MSCRERYAGVLCYMPHGHEGHHRVFVGGVSHWWYRHEPPEPVIAPLEQVFCAHCCTALATRGALCGYCAEMTQGL